jgi:hypothetical protein|tara:strand:+ start:1208 stop:1639 length:432 start_codon:yes stop_codon:yes gene_type:complete
VSISKLLIPLICLIPLLACEEEEPAKQIEREPAQLQLKLTDLRYEHVDGRHTYFHKRHFTESIGNGVTLTKGKVCVERGKTCVSARVRYRIDGGKKLEQPGHHVATRLISDTITIEYWGKDDTGNNVRVIQELKVTGENFFIK